MEAGQNVRLPKPSQAFDNLELRGTLAALFLSVTVSQANAGTCPDFFRFVDFGQENASGEIYRGGPTLRAEGFDGRLLVASEGTDCRDVRGLAVDGRGNPIPIVRTVSYDPLSAGLDLLGLRVSIADDAVLLADQNAALHQSLIQGAAATLTQGDSFLCAKQDEPASLSCQLTSPYPVNAQLVVYCAAGQCDMPVLAIDAQLYVSATWTQTGSEATDALAVGGDISDIIAQIHDFLAPLSAAF